MAFGQGFATEECRSLGVPDHHQHHPEQQGTDPDHEHAPDTGESCIPVLGIGVLIGRDNKCRQQHDAAEEGK